MSKLNDPRYGRVLFADDDPPFRDSLSLLLARHGFECVCASSAREALESLKTAEFDVLIADIHMPGNENLEFVGEAAKSVPGLPVILLTGLPSVETAAQSIRLPVAAYLIKPPDTAQLCALLHQSIWDYRSRRSLQVSRQRLRQWDADLQEIEHRMDQPADSDQHNGSNFNFLSLTLRNMILTLADLERSIALLSQEKAPAALREVELIGALRHTVSVLEKTRQNFKSKDLGILRQELEHLLRSRE